MVLCSFTGGYFRNREWTWKALYTSTFNVNSLKAAAEGQFPPRDCLYWYSESYIKYNPKYNIFGVSPKESIPDSLQHNMAILSL